MRLHELAYLVALGMLSLAGACTAPPSSVRNCAIRVEIPGHGITDLPAHHSKAVVAGSSRRFTAHILENGFGVATPGGYQGMSGAPVYSASGRMVGAVASNFSPGVDAAPLALLPATEIDVGMAMGKRYGFQVPDTSVPVEAAGIAPGAAVGVFSVWGDVTKGAVGTLTKHENDEFLAFAHAVSGFDYGPQLLALATCPSLAIIPDTPFRTLPGFGVVIGTATYNGTRGVYGSLRLHPPSIQVDVVARSKTRSTEGHCSVVRDPRRAWPNCVEAIRILLARHESLHLSNDVTARLAIQADHGAPSVLITDISSQVLDEAMTWIEHSLQAFDEASTTRISVDLEVH